jgi:hypothetical protein
VNTNLLHPRQEDGTLLVGYMYLLDKTADRVNVEDVVLFELGPLTDEVLAAGQVETQRPEFDSEEQGVNYRF